MSEWGSRKCFESPDCRRTKQEEIAGAVDPHIDVKRACGEE